MALPIVRKSRELASPAGQNQELNLANLPGNRVFSDLSRRLVAAIRNPAWLCFTWLGISLGIGLIATPARFDAPTVTRPVALDIGREVFTALNRVELALLVGLLILVRTSGNARRYVLHCGALALIVIAQSAWLLPELAERSRLIVAGGTPPPSAAHALYGGLELVKLGLLLWIGISALAPATPDTRPGSGAR